MLLAPLGNLFVMSLEVLWSDDHGRTLVPGPCRGSMCWLSCQCLQHMLPLCSCFWLTILLLLVMHVTRSLELVLTRVWTWGIHLLSMT